VQGSPQNNVSYAELIGNENFSTNITASVQPVDPIYHYYVGQSIQRIDIPDKVTGKFEFVHDVTVPGMLHGRVVRPPTLDSTLVSVDKTPNGPGVVAIVVQGNFIGVVAETEWQAINAAGKLKPVWEVNPLPDQAEMLDSLVNGTPIAQSTLYDNGAVAQAIAESPTQMSATYYWPYQIHAPIGPPCAVADVHPGGATIWSGTQGPYPLRGTVAGMINLPVAAVHVIYVEASGCYGLDGDDNAALDAVLMSQAVGRPVRVQYMRADEQAWENYGQAMAMQASAGLDEDGNITAWQYTAFSASRGNRPNAGFPGNIPTGGLIGQPVQSAGKLAPPLPPTGPDSSNAATLYTFERQQVLTKTIASRFYTGPMRAPNRIQNTFANESFMDELAYKAGKGPLAFRLANLNEPRMIAVFQQVAADAKWNDRVRNTGPGRGSGQIRTGWGLAGMRYEGTGGYAAAIMNVSVDTKTGLITVLKAYGAQDCGICINPDGMRNQAEGCFIQGISRTLREELTWTPKGITSVDWVTYPIAHFEQLPQEVHFSIISDPENPVLGAGEVQITPTPAAIANAVFDAIGVRIRQVPMTPGVVKAAIKEAQSA
jgi:CO/xanthine dehydrogenase Mo-binding subunit